MAGSLMVTQRDVVNEPQYIVEGITVALYGVTPADPAFTAAGQNGSLVKDTDPTVAEKRLSGKIDRQEKTKTREKNAVTLKTMMLSADEPLLAWAQNLPNGAGTPDESRTFFWSYNDDAISPNETFEQFKGCKPQTSTLTIDNEGYLTLEITMSCKTITVDTTGPTLGSGSLATPLVGTPLIASDSGAEPFTYNGAAYEQKGFSITVAFTEAIQDASGLQTDLFRRPTQRTITGSIDLFKKSDVFDVDARAVVTRAASLVVETAMITATFTRFLFMPSGEEITGDTSEASIETKNFEADVLVWA